MFSCCCCQRHPEKRVPYRHDVPKRKEKKKEEEDPRRSYARDKVARTWRSAKIGGDEQPSRSTLVDLEGSSRAPGRDGVARGRAFAETPASQSTGPPWRHLAIISRTGIQKPRSEFFLVYFLRFFSVFLFSHFLGCHAG